MINSPLSPFEKITKLERRGIRALLGPLREAASNLNLFPYGGRAIHVAGTNGKGSVAVMIDHLLRQHGFSVGRYTSPHLHDFRERIVVDGENIGIEALSELSDRVLRFSEEEGIGLTFFEATTLVALLYFKELKTDWVVLEVGMGGRLDATNIIDSELVALPSIGLDHTEWLGSTEGEIAREKCGVLRRTSRLVTGPLSAEAENAVRYEVIEKDVSWFKYGDSFFLEDGHLFRMGEKSFDITLPLPGRFQHSNCAVALASVELALCNLDPVTVNRAFSNVRWPGRFELINENPEVRLDVAHNPAGMEALITSLPPEKGIDFWYSASRGKDIQRMCDLLLARGSLYYLDVEHERLMSFSEFSSMYPGCAENIRGRKRLNDLKINSLVRPTVLCGSVYMIGEVRKYLNMEWEC